MMSGFDRYYQIVKCFRDEDLRADRQPEFTQIDVETSFMTAGQVREVMEAPVRSLWNDVKGVELGDFPIMTFAEAERRYGSDKPDLRNPMELVDVADPVKAVEFAVFAGPANDPKGRVAALRVPGGAALSRKQIDDYGNFIKIYGAKGLAYIKVTERAKGLEGITSPVAEIPECGHRGSYSGAHRRAGRRYDLLRRRQQESRCGCDGRAASEARQRPEPDR